MSDNSGEISWTSDDNEGESFTSRALDTPLKIPRYKRRKKKNIRNLSNLNVSLIDASAQNNPKSPVLGKTSNVKTNLSSPILKSTPQKSHIPIRKSKDLNDENDVKSVDPPSPIFKPSYSNKKPTTSPRLKLSQAPLTTTSKKNNKLLTIELSPTTLIEEINKPHLSPEHVRSGQCNSVNMKTPIKSPILCTYNRISSRSFRSKLNFTPKAVVTDQTKKFIESRISCPPVVRHEETNKVATTLKIGKKQRKINTDVSDPHSDLNNVLPKIFTNNIPPKSTSNITKEIKDNVADNGRASIYKNTCNKANRNVISGKVLIKSEAKESLNTLKIKHNIDSQNISDNSNSSPISPDMPMLHHAPNKTCKKRILSDLTSPPDEKVVKKIKPYFESHFSSHSNTQLSICGSTPQSHKETNSEGRILTQVDITESNSPLVSQETFKISSERSSSSDANTGSTKLVVIKSETEDSPKRRRRYRKNGLAGRLQLLLKKQKNQLFLWQHEIYLASNSNFVVPNSNPYRLYGIKIINADYGCYLIEAVDVETEKECHILLNVNFDCNVTLSEKSFLKLSEPFQVMETPIGTVIVNACKFECIKLQDE